MKRVFLALLFISQITFAQDVVKNLKPFHALTISSAMEVELVYADAYKIEVTGSDNASLSIDNKGKELKLSTSLKNKFKSNLKVVIYYNKGLSHIKLANNVIFTAKQPIIEKYLEIETLNNVRVDISLQTEDFKAILNLGSIITLKGSTDTQNILAKNKSLYDAFYFKAKKSFIEVKASKANIYTHKLLDAIAKYKGEIVYMGEPFSVNEKTFLGKVIHKK